MVQDRDSYLAIIQELEQKFNNTNLDFMGVNWWPLVKIQVAYQLHLQLTTPLSLSEKTDFSSKLKVTSFSVKFHILRLYKLSLYRIKKRPQTSHVSIYSFGSNKTSKTEEGNLINPYTDYFVDAFRENNINFTVTDLDTISTKHDDLLKPQLYFLKNQIIQKLKTSSVFTDAITDIEKHIGRLVPVLHNIGSWLIDTIIENQFLYEKLKLEYSQESIDKILLYCYYNSSCMAVSRAAREKNIEVVEYQHSLISNQHFAYKNWGAVNPKSIAFFPKTFWLWDQKSNDIIESNFQFLKDKKTLIGGNLYTQAAIDSFNKENIHQSAVLISLQGIGIPKFIIDAIESTDNTVWYLRLHPRYPNDQPLIKELSLKYGNKVELELANTKSLPYLFARVNYHITCFSGTALEAQVFGITNLIFGQEGRQSYSKEIEEGTFTFIESTSQLCTILNDEKLSTKNTVQHFASDKLQKQINYVFKTSHSQ